MSDILTPEEQELFEEINKFRKDPESIREAIKTARVGCEQTCPKKDGKENPIIPKLKSFEQHLLVMFNPVPPLKISKELTEVAHDYVKKAKKNFDPSKKYLYGEECDVCVPKKYINSIYTGLFCQDIFLSGQQTVVKLLVDEEDTQQTARAFLTSPEIKQIGICIDKKDEDDDGFVVIIMDDDEMNEDEDVEIEEDMTELRLAFDALAGAPKKSAINLTEAMNYIEEFNKVETDPVLCEMMKELYIQKGGENPEEQKPKKGSRNAKKKEEPKEPTEKPEVIVTWPEFKNFFVEKLSKPEDIEKVPHDEEANLTEEQEKKLSDIYKVFLDSPDNETMDMAKLKKIRDYIKLDDFPDRKIKSMLHPDENGEYIFEYQDYKNHVTKKPRVEE
jgi:hypothetical protein